MDDLNFGDDCFKIMKKTKIETSAKTPKQVMFNDNMFDDNDPYAPVRFSNIEWYEVQKELSDLGKKIPECDKIAKLMKNA